MKKYYYPEEIERVVAELRQIKTDFFHLSVCKGTGQPDGEYLDGNLEDAFAHLAEVCEEIKYNVDDYFNYIDKNDDFIQF